MHKFKLANLMAISDDIPLQERARLRYEYFDREGLEPNKYDQLCYQVFQEFDKELNNQDTFCLY